MLNSVIDLSHHNPADFPALKAAGIAAVIHKATQGVSFVDDHFAVRKPQAIAAGLAWGAYHFGVDGDGANQARHFLSVAGTGGIQVLDFENEPSGQNMSVAQAEDFCAAVSQQTGKWPVIYADVSHIRELLGESTVIPASCPLWIAQYSGTPNGANFWPTPWKLWQYTDGNVGPEPHTIIGHSYDRDQFNGDTEDELLAWWTAQSF